MKIKIEFNPYQTDIKFYQSAFNKEGRSYWVRVSEDADLYQFAKTESLEKEGKRILERINHSFNSDNSGMEIEFIGTPIEYSIFNSQLREFSCKEKAKIKLISLDDSMLPDPGNAFQIVEELACAVKEELAEYMEAPDIVRAFQKYEEIKVCNISPQVVKKLRDALRVAIRVGNDQIIADIDVKNNNKKEYQKTYDDHRVKLTQYLDQLKSTANNKVDNLYQEINSKYVEDLDRFLEDPCQGISGIWMTGEKSPNKKEREAYHASVMRYCNIEHRKILDGNKEEISRKLKQSMDILKEEADEYLTVKKSNIENLGEGIILEISQQYTYADIECSYDKLRKGKVFEHNRLRREIRLNTDKYKNVLLENFKSQSKLVQLIQGIKQEIINPWINKIIEDYKNNIDDLSDELINKKKKIIDTQDEIDSLTKIKDELNDCDNNLGDLLNIEIGAVERK